MRNTVLNFIKIKVFTISRIHWDKTGTLLLPILFCNDWNSVDGAKFSNQVIARWHTVSWYWQIIRRRIVWRHYFCINNHVWKNDFLLFTAHQFRLLANGLLETLFRTMNSYNVLLKPFALSRYSVQSFVIKFFSDIHPFGHTAGIVWNYSGQLRWHGSKCASGALSQGIQFQSETMPTLTSLFKPPLSHGQLSVEEESEAKKEICKRWRAKTLPLIVSKSSAINFTLINLD